MGFFDNKYDDGNKKPDSFLEKPKQIPENRKNGIFDNINSFLDNFIGKMSFEEYIKRTSQEIDKRILDIEMKELLKFVGGSCTFDISKDKTMLSGCLEMFFQDERKKWIKKTEGFNIKTSTFASDVFNNEFTQMPIKIDVDPPQNNL